ncbi:hypothetical protein [Streptomyces sp. NPDC050560]|uniref:hypothetical protein n=1 Tax=Streptomyces sp. NPDC050560 TaxID=3365630 RepID=UPI0037AF1B75
MTRQSRRDQSMRAGGMRAGALMLVHFRTRIREALDDIERDAANRGDTEHAAGMRDAAARIRAVLDRERS